MKIDWNLENFTPEELLSPIGLRQLGQNNLMMDLRWMIEVQEWRQDVGKLFLINHAGLKYRGYRSPKENIKAGGVECSRHVQGLAIDLTIPGVSPGVVAEWARERGYYAISYGEKDFCHVDARTQLVTDDNEIEIIRVH